ncbi:MAG: ribulose-phosphate 3-epimerase [Chloroflexi bacterium]|nr:ribulose-phosphate 3-epimerase [Chloroflexota bacterium]|tara:strand:- start:1169 stop:1846 length:678 start_codon:yes stop_codon:yes gene_type:complete
MCRNLTLSASIISADFLRMGEQLDELMQTDCKEVHYDVMDGHFVPNLSAGPVIFDSIKEKIQCTVDIHLMVKRPLSYIKDFSKIGANVITFHIESDDDPVKVIKEIKESGMSAAIALNPETDWQKVVSLMKHLDRILFMTVIPGASGRSFEYHVIEKIKNFVEKNKKFLDLEKFFQIGVDGGISKDTAKLAVDAGANLLVSGSSIFWNNEKSISEAVSEIIESTK